MVCCFFWNWTPKKEQRSQVIFDIFPLTGEEDLSFSVLWGQQRGQEKNDCLGLTPEQLKKPHSSRPWNPLMANVFYRRGIIETWGRGTLKIMELLDKARLPAPEFFNQTWSFVVIFRIPEEKQLTPQVTPHDAPQVEQLLDICIQPLSRQELQDGLGLKDREHFRKYYLRPALEAG